MNATDSRKWHATAVAVRGFQAGLSRFGAVSCWLWAICLLVGLQLAVSRAADEPIIRFANAVEHGDLATVEKMLAAGLDPNLRVPGNPHGFTPLFLAVLGTNPAVTAALLKAGADPAIEDANGDPVMFLAANRDRLAHARLLLGHGVAIDARNSRGVTPLMDGSRCAEATDVQAKLELGADPNLTDPRGDTALMYAAAGPNLEAMRVLIAAGAKVDVRNQTDQTALTLVLGHLVLEETDLAVPSAVELLIGAGANANLCDPAGNSPLMLALPGWGTQPETIRALLKAGPDVRIRNQDGCDALYRAVQNPQRNLHIARLLELGADLTTTDNEGVDLLMLAAANNDPALVRDLLERGLSPARKATTGMSAVLFAINSRRFNPDPFDRKTPDDKLAEILTLLHQHGGSLTDADDDGDTPLHLVAMTRINAAAALLLPHFPDPEVRNHAGETPLHLAAASGSEDIVELFLAHHAAVDARDAEGRTPLMHASANDHAAVVRRLQQAGANLNAAATDGSTAFSTAMAANAFEQLRVLVELGANPKSLAEPGTHLLRAARLFHDQPVKPTDYAFVIELLADHAGDLNLRDAGGVTALQWIAASNNPTALKAILKHHPDVQARSPDGRTALMWAASSQALESLQLLRAAGADESLRDATGRTAAEWLVWANVAHDPPARDVSAGPPELGERILRSRQAALREYLSRNVWNAADRIAGASPLHLAAALGDGDAIRALLKRGAPVNLAATDLGTPLMDAAANGHLKAVEILLDNGANPSLRDDSDDRAIDLAIQLEHLDVVRLFLTQKDPFSGNETTLLVALVRRGDEQLLREFLKAGAAIPHAGKRPDEMERLGTRLPDPAAPLAAAATLPDPRLLRVLLEYPAATGADEPAYLTAALHQAAAEGCLGAVKLLVEERKIDANTLLSDSFGGVTLMANGEPDDKGPQPVTGFSALSRALEEGHAEIVRYLVERGATITGRTRGGEPPLTFAVSHRQHDMLQYLLEHHAPTELVDFSGETALHRAAAANDVAAVRLLLDHGAEPKAKTRTGKTALDLARDAKAADAAALLE